MKRVIRAATIDYGTVKHTSAPSYDLFQSLVYNKQKYTMYCTDTTEFDEFRCQITKVSPYDDAEYFWAKYEPGIIQLIQNGRVVHSMSVYLPKEEDGANFEDWMNDVLIDVLDALEYYNSKIKSVMQHN